MNINLRRDNPSPDKSEELLVITGVIMPSGLFQRNIFCREIFVTALPPSANRAWIGRAQVRVLAN
jgi:hypothetical protein